MAFNITDNTATPPTYETFYRCNAALNLAGLNCSIPPCDQKVKARFDLDNSDSNITVTRNAKGEAAGDNAILICKGKGKHNKIFSLSARLIVLYLRVQAKRSRHETKSPWIS